MYLGACVRRDTPVAWDSWSGMVFVLSEGYSYCCISCRTCLYDVPHVYLYPSYCVARGNAISELLQSCGGKLGIDMYSSLSTLFVSQHCVQAGPFPTEPFRRV